MIKIIKLINDHEIIGDFIEDNDDNLTLGDPFSIHYLSNNNSDKPVIGLLRYMPFAQQREITFRKKDIINNLDARSSMANYYKCVVDNHVKFIDKNIDDELQSVAEEEAQYFKQQQMSRSEMMAELLSKFTNNKKMH